MFFEDSQMSIGSPLKTDYIPKKSWSDPDDEPYIYLPPKLKKEPDSEDSELSDNEQRNLKTEITTKQEPADVEDKSNFLSPEVSVKTERKSPERREISLDIPDPENCSKFDQLVKKERIKTPLKRRLSAIESDPSILVAVPYEHKFAIHNLSKKPKINNRYRSGSTSSGNSSNDDRRNLEVETDAAVLMRRQKQIDYGKNTVCYDRYCESIPRVERTREHPKTPPMHLKYSRRGWDGLIKIWRKKLHCWDQNAENQKDSNDEKEAENSDAEKIEELKNQN